MLSASKLIFGPSAVVISLIASYYDIKSKKVPNWLISNSLIVSLALNIMFFTTSRVPYLIFPFILNILVSAAIAIILLVLDFWRPGDVKLYFALSTFLHPFESGLILKPLMIFIILSIIATVLEAVLLRNFEFKLQLSKGMLLPVVVSPVISFIGINRLVIFFIFFLLGNRLKRFETPITVCAIMAFLISPFQVLRTLAFLSIFVIAGSIKFKGHFPSSPFISASFIYLLIFEGV